MLGNVRAVQLLARRGILRRGLGRDKFLEGQCLAAIAGNRGVREVLGQDVLILQGGAHSGGRTVVSLEHLPSSQVVPILSGHLVIGKMRQRRTGGMMPSLPMAREGREFLRAAVPNQERFVEASFSAVGFAGALFEGGGEGAE